MKLSDLKNKKILIVGFGVEGKVTYAFLKKHFPKATIGIADAHDDPHYLDKQKDYDIAIKSPGIHKSKITIPYTTATNIFFANVKGLTIGVTGTKGKSTTATLIFSILKQAGKKVFLLGNITHKLQDFGKPLLSELDQDDEDTIYICELSSYQLDDIKYAPDISVFTNFFPEHMDFHGSVDKYWKAKKKIIAYANSDDFFVYNPDATIVAKLATKTKAKSIPFVESLSFPDKIIPLLGKHNFDNVRAAVTVAKILGISDKTITNAIASFKSLPHRMEKIGTYHSITFYDDAISTTPQSTIYAIETLKNIGTLFLGGQDRGYDFSELAKIIVKYHITNLVLFPDSSKKILKAIQKIYQGPLHILETANMHEAVSFAYSYSPKGSIALLSTASPSYSVWKNFEEKGKLFREEVINQGK